MPRRNKRAKPVCIAALTALLLGGGNQAWTSFAVGLALRRIGRKRPRHLHHRHDAGYSRLLPDHRITGDADGGTITQLQATDTAVPGNAGFPVDNLVSQTAPQLTKHGFGFSVSNGEYHNTFYNGHHLDYISLPPYVDGAGGEPMIHFTAKVRRR